MAKRGPKPKIGPKEEAEIFACLTVGASLKDAADYLGVNYSTVRRHRISSPKFAQGIIKAISKGKLHHLNKIGKAPQWQASAFMLERKWGAEFGRKDKIEHAGTVAHDHKHEFHTLMDRAATDSATGEMFDAIAERLNPIALGNPSQN